MRNLKRLPPKQFNPWGQSIKWANSYDSVLKRGA